MIGKRLPDDLGSDWVGSEPGSYWRGPLDMKGTIGWFCRVPTKLHVTGNLSGHEVEEHEDGTITVSPSILIDYGDAGFGRWHGYLRRGVWERLPDSTLEACD